MGHWLPTFCHLVYFPPLWYIVPRKIWQPCNFFPATFLIPLPEKEERRKKKHLLTVIICWKKGGNDFLPFVARVARFILG
jgi:hypothetical protein